MLEPIKTTGLNFTTGQKLSSSDMNILNRSINSLIEAVNKIMNSEININLEEGSKEKYSLEEALSLVPKSRRIPGIKLTFLGESGLLETYTYLGGDWDNFKSWGLSENETIIDGGEW